MPNQPQSPTPEAQPAMPRRINVEKLTPAEASIRTAIHAVEELAADPRQTRVVILLCEAASTLADLVDKLPLDQETYRSWLPKSGAEAKSTPPEQRADQVIANMRSHKWTTVRAGSNPAVADSYERVRYCEVCGIEDSCEDDLPPCAGYARAEAVRMPPLDELLVDGIAWWKQGAPNEPGGFTAEGLKKFVNALVEAVETERAAHERMKGERKTAIENLNGCMDARAKMRTEINSLRSDLAAMRGERDATSAPGEVELPPLDESIRKSLDELSAHLKMQLADIVAVRYLVANNILCGIDQRENELLAALSDLREAQEKARSWESTSVSLGIALQAEMKENDRLRKGITSDSGIIISPELFNQLTKESTPWAKTLEAEKESAEREVAELRAALANVVVSVDVQKAKDVILSYFPSAVPEPWKNQWTIRITPQTTMGLGGTPEAAWMSFGIGFANKKDAYNERAERAEAALAILTAGKG